MAMDHLSQDRIRPKGGWRCQIPNPRDRRRSCDRRDQQRSPKEPTSPEALEAPHRPLRDVMIGHLIALMDRLRSEEDRDNNLPKIPCDAVVNSASLLATAAGSRPHVVGIL